MKNFKIHKYEKNGIKIDVRFDLDNNTIWLTQSEIALVLNLSKDNVKQIIKRIHDLNSGGDNLSPTETTTELISSDGKTYKTKLYNIEMIEVISLRSKSTNGYDFVKWSKMNLSNIKTANMIELSPNEEIKSKIHDVDGVPVMLDFELAKLYGYETRAFNQQVTNNIDKFDSDFMFKLSENKWNEILISKNLMSSWGGIRRIPYAFTEQGVYMLMTVLKGDLATKQSKLLIRTFKAMKDYIVEKDRLSNSKEILELSHNNEVLTLKNTVNENSLDIEYLKIQNNYNKNKFKTIDDRFDNVEKELVKVMDNFIDPSKYKHYIFYKGERIESDIAYQDIYSKAKHNVYIIDDYISLQLLKRIKRSIKVIIFSDNKDKIGLSSLLFNDFIKDTNLNITLLHNNTYHDRYVILDYGYKDMRVYHSGASSKDGGNSGYEIDEREYPHDYDERIKIMLKNNELMIK